MPIIPHIQNKKINSVLHELYVLYSWLHFVSSGKIEKSPALHILHHKFYHTHSMK